ncbi:BolA-like protein 3 [Savitreella phatthalungensis]
MLLRQSLLRTSKRGLCTTRGARALDRPKDAGEAYLFDKLAGALSPSHLVVRDISGGCGASYAIEVEASAFKGKSPVAQQRLVNAVIKEDMTRIHAVSLKTSAPK